jgi:hypothetical protein
MTRVVFCDAVNLALEGSIIFIVSVGPGFGLKRVSMAAVAFVLAVEVDSVSEE